MKHKTLLVYVPCLEGGCEDVGRIDLAGHTLVSDERLWDLEATESTRRDDYQNWMTALDRNAELLVKLEAAEKERDVLKAKITEMEKQEPVAWMSSRNGFICKENKNPDYNVPLKRFDLGAQREAK